LFFLRANNDALPKATSAMKPALTGCQCRRAKIVNAKIRRAAAQMPRRNGKIEPTPFDNNQDRE
jgi:hypothetical protein